MGMTFAKSFLKAHIVSSEQMLILEKSLKKAEELKKLQIGTVYGEPGSYIKDADLIIGLGTRYSDFTTISKSSFQNPRVEFININVAEFDSFKHGALPLVGDARAILEEIDKSLSDFEVSLP